VAISSRIKQLKQMIALLTRRVKKYNPFHIKKVKTYNIEVATNKRVYFTYRAKNKGVFRLTFRVSDQAGNKSNSSKFLVKWLQVK
jgi:hypothetical protein